MINILSLTIKEAIALAEMYQDDQDWDLWGMTWDYPDYDMEDDNVD